MQLSPHPIVILGMQRSGTSAVAGALTRLGAYLGSDEDFFPADVNNSAGYFEQRSLTALNHKCLAFFQMHAASVRPLPESWRAYPQSSLLLGELRDLLEQNFRGQPTWGFKQPMACLLTDLYASVFRELGIKPQFVVCVRNPLEVMASEANWQYLPGGRQMAPLGKLALGTWLRYTLGALQAAGDNPLTIVPYPSFLSSPQAILAEIVARQPTWHPSEEQWSNAIASVRPGLRRQDVPAAELASVPALVKETLAYCAEGQHDADRLASLVSEFHLWLEMLEPPKLAGTRLGFAWMVGGEVQSVQEPFLPTGDWQVVRLLVQAPPRTELNGLFYNKPCRVWIRRCVFVRGPEEIPTKIYPGPGSQLGQLEGILRLDGAYEPRQISLITPDTPGPFELEIEFLLESGTAIVNDAAARISQRLHECSARRQVVEGHLASVTGGKR